MSAKKSKGKKPVKEAPFLITEEELAQMLPSIGMEEPINTNEHTLSELDHTKALLISLQSDYLELKMEKVNIERQAYVRKIDPENILSQYDASLRQLAKEISLKKTEFRAHFVNVGEKMNIHIDKFVWDDVTGKLKDIDSL